jgi:signal transduction histidine kinase/CheY-like chemotaxis protein
MRSLVVAALVKGGRLVAGFGVQTARPRAWHGAELALVRETAERTWDAAERARAEEALREAGRLKDEFLATLAHELRNPLAPLRNGLELLQAAGGASDVAPMALAMMDRQLGHLVRLVDDLLDVARVSAGKIGLRRQPLALAEVIARSVEASRAVLQQHGHELRVEAGGADLVVDADLDRLVQVFSNLLANAAKYTDRGGRISVQARSEGGQAVVEVRDTGIGIPKEELARVFDLFAQVRMHQGRAEGGLGIGLALTQKLVHLHGGGIEAESAGVGQGSTFRVRLPLAASLPAGPDTRPAEAPALPRRPRRVLVVDDNVDAAVSLAALLRREGHEVAVAHDGWQALEQVPRFRPEVVILDLGMPGLDGIEAARRLREIPEGRGLRLVALTGWGQTADQQRTREAGFDRHLVKPAEREEVLRALGA